MVEATVLGVDPGCITTGFSIITLQGGRTELLEAGALGLGTALPLYRRIGIFHRFFHDKIMQYRVSLIALETPFLGKNAQNFLKLGYLRGGLYLLQDLHNLAVHEFSPTEVKRAVTGYGGADKEQVARFLLRLFPSLVMPHKLDITDAVAIGLCGAWEYERNQRQGVALRG